METSNTNENTCQTPTEESCDAVRSRLDEYMEAYNTGDISKVAAFYSPDSYFAVPGHKFIRGPTGFIKSGIVKQMMDLGGKILVIHPADVVGAPESVSVIGTYNLFNESGVEVDDGRAVYVWVKTDDEWLLKYDIFN